MARAGSTTQSFSVNAPTSVIYDPVPTDCGSNSNGTTTNTTGCFIVNSSAGNSVNVIDPVSSIQTAFRVGINPTAIAYNFRTSTLVSTNTASHTVTVADFLGQKIRAVLTLPPTNSVNANRGAQFGLSGRVPVCIGHSPFHECRRHRGHGQRASLVRALASLAGARPTREAAGRIATSTGKEFAGQP